MTYLLALISLISAFFYHYQALKIYQLSYYRLGEFIHSLKSKIPAVALYFFVPVFCQILALILPYISLYIIIGQFLLSLGVYFHYKKSAKTQINFTHRLTLFLLLSVIIVAPLSLGLSSINLAPILPLAYTLCAMVSHLIVGQIYKVKNRNYIHKAQT